MNSRHRYRSGRSHTGWVLPLLTVSALLLIAAGVALTVTHGNPHLPQAVPAARVPSSPSASSTPDKTLSPVRMSGAQFASWALLDRRTGRITGSRNLKAPSDTLSLIKVWLAADLLRQANGYPDERMLQRLSVMIRDSDNKVAEQVYQANGRRDSIERMIQICGLTDSAPYVRNFWSNTVVSARDVARLGVCLADGRAAGPLWTDWLLEQMRGVRGEGDFGARQAFPAAVGDHLATKNGWLLRDEDKLWHVACLTVSSTWSLAVLLRYPADLGLTHGKHLCRQVAEQLFGI